MKICFKHFIICQQIFMYLWNNTCKLESCTIILYHYVIWGSEKGCFWRPWGGDEPGIDNHLHCRTDGWRRCPHVARYEVSHEERPATELVGFCSIFREWSHDYGKSGTYSKVCETLVHIPVDFVSTQLKWTFIWVWQNQLVYVPRFHILWYVPLSPKFLAENNFSTYIYFLSMSQLRA